MRRMREKRAVTVKRVGERHFCHDAEVMVAVYPWLSQRLAQPFKYHVREERQPIEFSRQVYSSWYLRQSAVMDSARCLLYSGSTDSITETIDEVSNSVP